MQGRGVEIHWGPSGCDPWVHVGRHHHPPGIEAQHLRMVCVEGALRVGGWRVHLRPVLHLVQLLLSRERDLVRQELQGTQRSSRRHGRPTQNRRPKEAQMDPSVVRLSGCRPAPKTGRTIVLLSQREPMCSSNTSRLGFHLGQNLLELTTDQQTPPRDSLLAYNHLRMVTSLSLLTAALFNPFSTLN